MDKLLNYVLFQFGWFVCVLLGTTQYHLIGPLIVALVVAYHLNTLSDPVSEMRLIGFALVLGIIWENLLAISGLLAYPQGQPWGMFAPVWIMAMWPLLAITLNLSMRWLKEKYLLAALFGGMGGPMAFLAGERLGAVHIPDTTTTITVLAIGWAILFPILMKFSMQNDGYIMKFEYTSGKPA